MFTARQGARRERKEGMDTQARAAPAGGLPWTRRAKQHACTPGCFPEREAVVLWLCDPTFPVPIDVHQVVVVEDLRCALRTALQQGYTLAVEPVMVMGGKCAVVQNTSGLRLCLLEKAQAS